MPTPHVDPLDIAVLNTVDYGGGAETCVRMLQRGLKGLGHRASLWVGRRIAGDGDSQRVPIDESQMVRVSKHARKGFFSLGIADSRRFARSEDLSGVDIIHLHNLHGHYFSLEAVPLLAERAPLVWTFHDFFPITGGCVFPQSCDRWRRQCGSCPQLGRYPIASSYDRTRRLLSIKRNLLRDLPVTIVTPSQHLSNAVRASRMFTQAEIETIPYGVDTEVFRPAREPSRAALALSQDAIVVTLIAQGLRNPRKGIHHAIEALRAYDRDKLSILLVGADDTRAFEDALSRHQVRAPGYIADRRRLAQCLAAADLFLFTSLAENFPCVVQESMACGAPVLAFEIDGVKEQIQPDKTGFLVPTGNTPALTQALSALLGDRSRLRETGQAARRYAVREWTVDRFLNRHQELYYACTKNKIGTSRIHSTATSGRSRMKSVGP